MQQRKSWLAFVCALWMSLTFALLVMSTTAQAQTKVTVHKGDSLWWIAQQHSTTVQRLVFINHLSTDVLQIHQKLLVPDHHTAIDVKVAVVHSPNTPATHDIKYKVKSGDTLWSIAVRFHTNVKQLQHMNGLHSSIIYPKQKLWIKKTAAVVNALHHNAASAAIHQVNRRTGFVHGVPARFLSVYQSAGQRYGIPWTVLAAIHKAETNFGTAPEVSVDGARGPMQFMISTFIHYAVKAPGEHGAPDINNVYDAIYTCAHMLAADGYRRNADGALYLYNHSTAYVSNIRQLASSFAA